MKKILTRENIKQIGREYGEKGPTLLSKELGVTKQRVAQIVFRLRKLGAPIPKPKHRLNQYYAEIAEELKAEM